jgi:hypothetical protein
LVHFRIDAGAEQVTATAGNPGNAAIMVPEGNHTLEYWGEDDAGNVESPHHVASVQVDTTPPTLSITSDQGFASYEIGDKATVTIKAHDATSGLAADPSAGHVAISTARPGRFTLGLSATDHCANATKASFTYTVVPNPTFAKTVNLEPLAGTVLVRQSAGAGSARATGAANNGFVALAGARQVPVGSIVDATAGTVRVTAETAIRGKIQTGAFGGSRFKIVQSRARHGLAELRLIDAQSRRPCARKTRVLGTLRAEAAGRFRTSGRYSSATLTGRTAVWQVTDRCDGTLTRVSSGSITVRDARKRTTVIVHAGGSYLARRR